MNQKGFIKDVVIIALGILLLGGGYFYLSKKPAYAPAENSNANQKVADETANWKTYRNEKYGFEIKYPEYYSAEENPDGVAIVGFFKKDGYYEASGIKAYYQDVKFKSLAEYENNLRSLYFNLGGNNVIGEKFYSTFVVKKLGEAMVILHRRNFEGMIGNVYEMYVWLGDGKILIFYSEDDNDILNKIYNSFRLFK